jgi:acetyl-CoA C-acetyltransferase
MPRKKVAVIGYGIASYGALSPEVSYKEMMYEACSRAYQMAGVNPRKDVDSFVTCSEDYDEGTSIFDEYVPDQMGAMLRPTHTIAGDGLQGVAAGVMQILTKRFDVVVVEAHSKASNVTDHAGLLHFAEDPAFTRPILAHPYFLAGLEMRCFLTLSGNMEIDAAKVVVKNKNNALKNPLGVHSANIALEDVLASEPSFEPLKKLDEARLSDIGLCVVLASEDVANKFVSNPVWITGIGWCSDSFQPERRELCWPAYAKLSADMAYQQAGIKNPARAFQVAEIDDTFSYKELQHIETIGLARVGESGEKLEEGAFGIDGEIAVNASGGSLGCGRMLDATGLFRLIEVVKQLRGEAGAYQVKNARAGVALSWRGIPTATGAVCVLEV